MSQFTSSRTMGIECSYPGCTEDTIEFNRQMLAEFGDNYNLDASDNNNNNNSNYNTYLNGHKYTESELIKHIKEMHSSDLRIVLCPICEANGMTRQVLSRESLLNHIDDMHNSNHNPITHPMLKIPFNLPYGVYIKIFKQSPEIDTSSFVFCLSNCVCACVFFCACVCLFVLFVLWCLWAHFVRFEVFSEKYH